MKWEKNNENEIRNTRECNPTRARCSQPPARLGCVQVEANFKYSHLRTEFTQSRRQWVPGFELRILVPFHEINLYLHSRHWRGNTYLWMPLGTDSRGRWPLSPLQQVRGLCSRCNEEASCLRPGGKHPVL